MYMVKIETFLLIHYHKIQFNKSPTLKKVISNLNNDIKKDTTKK